ncbi:MAG TPA: hypothetical protein VGM77_11370 [Gemmatimonadales bacterium]
MIPRIATPALLLAATLALAAGAGAQTFKVTKYDIGGIGGTDYLTAEPGTGRVFVSRGSHVMVVDGRDGKVLGDIPDTPRMHGIALAMKDGHGFTTNGGDSTITMFDLKTLAVIKKIQTHTAGHDGIMYDDATDRIYAINHGRPNGSLTAIDARTGDVVGAVQLDGTAPEGGASDGKGKLYINMEDKSAITVVDSRALTVLTSWPIAPCDGPSGIALDRASNRIFSGCGKTSVVTDVATGKVVAQIANGDGVDALGWDSNQKLIYIPAGRDGNITVVHQDSPDKYTVVATVTTVPGAKTIAVDEVKHIAYLFQPQYGPAPAGAPTSGRGGPRGPIVAAWFVVVTH